jgi:uncharacterized protein YbgA (DUF1722 family)
MDSAAAVAGRTRVEAFFAGDWTPGELAAFHAREKLLVRVHDPLIAGELGRLVAGAGWRDRDQVAERYQELHARALARPATPGRHQDALEHLAGHLKGRLARGERAELQVAIEGFRAGRVPLEAPQALLRRHLRAAGADWAVQQAYLDTAGRE